MDEKNVSKSILNIRNIAVLAIFGLMIWFVVAVRNIIGIFLFSMVMAFLLYPPVESLTQKKIPRSLAIVIVYLILALIAGLIFLLVVPDMYAQAEILVGRLFGTGENRSVGSSFAEWSTNLVHFLNDRFGTNIEVREIVIANQEKITAIIGDILDRAKIFALSITSIITLMITIPVICFYLLMDWSKIKESLMKFLPPNMKIATDSLMDQLTITLNSYLRGQIKLSFLMFIITTGLLLIFNLLGAAIPSYGFHIGPYLILGILAGITEVIPMVGPIIAFIPAVILGFMNGPATGITVILLYGFIQLFEGNILVPRVMGNKLEIHPLTVMFALLCGGLLGGVGGMLLSLPAAATLKVLFEQYYSGFIMNVENLLLEQKKETEKSQVTGET